MLNTKHLAAVAAAAAIAVPLATATDVSAPVRVSPSFGSFAITATVTAPAGAALALESTAFQLGTDPWRVRATAVSTGDPHRFYVPCIVTRATYGWRVTIDGAPGPALYTKCR